MPGCPALECVILNIKETFPFEVWEGYVHTRLQGLDRLLSSLPRLFYVLILDGEWTLPPALPPGWERHPVPLEAEGGGDMPLILEPRGVFTREVKVCVDVDEGDRPIVLFNPGRSPVRLEEGNAAWRWVQPQRGGAVWA